MSISSSGQYGMACTEYGYIYYSSDYGANWLRSDAIFNGWMSISISNTGQYGIACSLDVNNYGDGRIWYSNNYGKNWTTYTSPSNLTNGDGNWSAVSMMDSGKYAIACTSTNTATGASGRFYQCEVTF